MSSANGLRLNCVNGGEINCRRVQSSSDWHVISFFAPCSAIFGTLDTYSILFGTWPWNCSGGIPVAGIFSPMETTFCPQSRCLVSPREAKDPRWIIFCSALLLFYPSTDPFFYFFSFSSPCLFYCHRVVCSVSSSLSLLRSTSPSPSCLAPYSQSFHPYCKLALMASSCSSLSRL